MLLGEQLLDEVQVVAVLGQLERREEERPREREGCKTPGTISNI